MPTYVLLGATGSTGSAVIRHLNTSPPAALSLNIYVRSTNKLLSQQPDISSKRTYTITEGNLSDTNALQECLKGADVIFCCTGSNETKRGMSVAQDSANAIISTLRSIQGEDTASWKAPTAIVLSSMSVNKEFTGPQPALARSFLHFSQYYNYYDLELAQALYEEAASVGLLRFIFAQPGAIMDPEGTEETGHSLTTEPVNGTISYSDLGAGFCELAERRQEFDGKEVCILATGKVKDTWSYQVGFLMRGVKGRLWG